MKRRTAGIYSILRQNDKFKIEGAGIHLKKAQLIPDGVVEFLLQNSPLAKVNFINNDD